MKLVNILEAKADFSELVRLIEAGTEKSIIIIRDGKPVVKMVSYNKVPVENRIGIAKGKLIYPDNIDEFNDEIAEIF